MNDAECAKQQARVQALIDAWIRPLGLGWWRWDIEWHREQERQAVIDEMSVPFTIAPLWKYGRARLDVYLPATAAWADDDLEEAFCHEMGHVFLAEVRPEKPSDEQLLHEEHAATVLAKAFVWLRDAIRDKERPPSEPGVYPVVPLGTADPTTR